MFEEGKLWSVEENNGERKGGKYHVKGKIVADVKEDHHDNAIVMFTEIISDRSLASVGDVQELDGQRGSDSVCGEEGLYDMSCFFRKK